MERKLPLIVALAVFGTLCSAGAVSASGGLLDNTTQGLNNTLNNTTQGLQDTVNGVLGGATGGGGGSGGGGGGLLGGGGGGSTTTPSTPSLPGTGTSTPPTGGGGGSTGGGSGSGGGAHGGVGPAGPGGSGGRTRHGGGHGAGGGPNSIPKRPSRQPNGVPTASNPTLTVASPGPAALGLPNFLIGSFEIPPFLLPIYQACGSQYGIPWEVLAGINKIETAFGTNLNVSSAGALGWMQFIPSTWKAYGVDANGDGKKDPYNPVDAICAAARYLKAAGGDNDVRRGIFAYNHADWYVDEVMLYARQYGNLPDDLLGSLTGLTQGDRFPVDAHAKYADDVSEHLSSPTPRGINIYARDGAPVVAVNDGTIIRQGSSKKLGRFLVLEDGYGNKFTYAELGDVRKPYRETPKGKGSPKPSADVGPKNTENARRRLFALPGRKHNQIRAQRVRRPARASSSAPTGSSVTAGTVLGHIGKTTNLAPHLNFAIQPAGKGAPSIDPKPILDGWKLLEATALYRAAGQNPLTKAPDISSVIQDLLTPKLQLERKVLADPRLSIYRCGRHDIRTNGVDRRVLSTMEYLADNGFRLTVTKLQCGRGGKSRDRGALPVSANPGNGEVMDVSKVNGIKVVGHEAPGSAADAMMKTALRLQGVMQPQQMISNRDLPGPVSFASKKPLDTVRIGFRPLIGAGYQNPFPNAMEGRVDMGVDFTGTGPILAIGNAKILKIGAPGWPQGGGVLYQLLDGPLAGRVIYVYEGVRPTVHPGQKVLAGEQVAAFTPGSIEIGFADTAGNALAHNVYTEGMVTKWGLRMRSFLHGLGAPGNMRHQFTDALAPHQWHKLSKRLEKIRNPAIPKSPPAYHGPPATP